jgi:DNA-binding transcriptional ArsR family regulator
MSRTLAELTFTDNDLKLATFAKALAHPVRIQIIRILNAQACCYNGDLTEIIPLAQSTISQHLKAMSKELSIPVISAAQLNRESERRQGMAKMPVLPDLREDGSIEQDADIILFLFRPEYYGIESYESETETLDTRNLLLVNIAKNRDGQSGSNMTIRLHCDLSMMRICNLDEVNNYKPNEWQSEF